MADDFDELSLLIDNATEAGLPCDALPPLRRQSLDLPDGRSLSALVWGSGTPEAVLVHGSAQNAHTWDTVALALGRPLVALDLAGHGHSSWRADHDYRPAHLAEDLAVAVETLAPAARLVVGMSLGGLSTIALAAARPELVRSLVLVDITPGVDAAKARAITEFTSGPEVFGSFEAMLARTIAHHPGRSEASLRRGVLHNARPLGDGSWSWRWDPRGRVPGRAGSEPDPSAPEKGWEDLGTLRQPLMLVRGSLSPVVDDADIAELRRRQPTAEVVVLDGAGHSVQGDRPLELAAILAGRLSESE